MRQEAPRRRSQRPPHQAGRQPSSRPLPGLGSSQSSSQLWSDEKPPLIRAVGQFRRDDEQGSIGALVGEGPHKRRSARDRQSCAVVSNALLPEPLQRKALKILPRRGTAEGTLLAERQTGSQEQKALEQESLRSHSAPALQNRNTDFQVSAPKSPLWCDVCLSLSWCRRVAPTDGRWWAWEAGWRPLRSAKRHGKRAGAIQLRTCNRASRRRLDTIMAVVYRSASRPAGEVCREENLSAAQQEPQTNPWLPRPHEDAGRPRDSAAPASQGPSETFGHHREEVARVGGRCGALRLLARAPAAQAARLPRGPDQWHEDPHQVFSGTGAKRRWPGRDYGDKEDWQRGDTKSAEAAHPRVCQAGAMGRRRVAPR